MLIARLIDKIMKSRIFFSSVNTFGHKIAVIKTADPALENHIKWPLCLQDIIKPNMLSPSPRLNPNFLSSLFIVNPLRCHCAELAPYHKGTGQANARSAPPFVRGEGGEAPR